MGSSMRTSRNTASSNRTAAMAGTNRSPPDKHGGLKWDVVCGLHGIRPLAMERQHMAGANRSPPDKHGGLKWDIVCGLHGIRPLANGTAAHGRELIGLHPTSMVASNGILYADFTEYGLLQWNGSTWQGANRSPPDKHGGLKWDVVCGLHGIRPLAMERQHMAGTNRSPPNKHGSGLLNC